jgi:diaminopimelate epimerase
MNVKFHKYQGAGNDFIVLNNRYNTYSALTSAQIQLLCDRHFGIGADGLMLLESLQGFDFKMVYFNSDGRQSTMCGNGGRCIIRFANDQKIVGEHTQFLAVDGPHDGVVNNNGTISLKMIDVLGVEEVGADYVLQTGSPHYVVFVENADEISIVEVARKIRYNERFKGEGINVNFVQVVNENEIYVRTYERGVEDGTLSCGTGVVASVLAFVTKQQSSLQEIAVKTKGGNLFVKFNAFEAKYTDVWLTGPAEKVFEGSVEI